ATVDREMLGALGVDVSKLYTEVFVFGSWLAGLGGALAAPTIAVALGMDADVLINAFVVVVIGGLGSFAGSLISALLVGEMQSFGILIFPAVSIVLLFAIMAVVLIVRPWGLLGHPEEGRAVAAPGSLDLGDVAVGSAEQSYRRIAILGIGLAVALILPWVVSTFFVVLLIEVAVVALFGTAFNLLMGFGGMVSFGHAAYFALGAYAAALLAQK